jgi:hypothetical protein
VIYLKVRSLCRGITKLFTTLVLLSAEMSAVSDGMAVFMHGIVCGFFNN